MHKLLHTSFIKIIKFNQESVELFCTIPYLKTAISIYLLALKLFEIIPSGFVRQWPLTSVPSERTYEST